HPGTYETVLTEAQFEALLGRLHAADAFAFDTETDGLDPMRARLVGLIFAIDPGLAWYLPLALDYAGAPAQLAAARAIDALRP
ncbi:hypothetical protein, partial [Klebsiella pneumoniae]|uniref:hypothetical protein n=1 Tax=Klebsiella pneumoniae TaxID=573 RepID=UPI0039E4236D